MWQKLLRHFEKKGCIANANEFLRSRNRIIDHKKNATGQFQQQRPYTAHEQQFRYPRQQMTMAEYLPRRAADSRAEYRPPRQGSQRFMSGERQSRTET